MKLLSTQFCTYMCVADYVYTCKYTQLDSWKTNV